MVHAVGEPVNATADLRVTLSDENLGGLEAGHDALDVDELLTELESINAVGLPVHSLQKVPF